MRTLRSPSLLPLVLLLAGFMLAQADAAWVRMADVAGQPSGKPVKGGGSVTSIDSTVYLIIGNNTLDVMTYSIAGNAWTPLAAGMPTGDKKKRAKKGACIADDGEKLYAFKGGSTNEFYSYDPAAAAWATLPSPEFTKGIKGGAATYASLGVEIVDEYIYASSGSNTGEWRRFHLNTGAWESALPAALPAVKVKVGNGLAFLDGTMYFLFDGGKSPNFYAANLNTTEPAWTAKQALPAAPPEGKSKKVKEGGCLVVFGDKLYAVKGGSTKQFWCYDPATDAWTYVGEVGDGAATKGIKCGTSLATFEGGLFCIIGNNTNEFWYYTPPITKAPASLMPAVAGSGAPMSATALTVSPNPARGEVGIRCTSPARGTARVTVYNSLGSVVYRAASVTGSFGSLRLPAGAYVVRLQSGAAEIERHLVVTE